MLANILALVVGLGSLAIYISAFFFPEIHRKNDFIWSGVGLFYALVLWVFAPKITGGLLLGHVASVALLVWFGWQTLSLRRQVTPQAQQTPVPSAEAVKSTIQEQAAKFSLQEKVAQLQQGIGNTLGGLKNKAQKTDTQKATTAPAPTPTKPSVEIIDNTEKPTQEAVTTHETPTVEPSAAVVTTDTASPTQVIPEVIPPHPPAPELVEAAQPHPEAENKEPIPVEEIAPDAVLAPPAEAPPEALPPNT
ncbi:MAG TPA: Ycf66 family protein [Leptolyngbyaceae cyanobacterium]